MLEMGVEFLARIPGCQGKRHMYEYVGERESEQLGTQARAGLG